MALSEPTSAIIVRVPIPARIARVRRQWGSVAAIGVPPHVTVLFPFLPPGHLDTAVRHELAVIAAAQDPAEVRFTAVGRFPDFHSVRAIEVITPSEAGPWRLRWRLPLGRAGHRPVRS